MELNILFAGGSQFYIKVWNYIAKAYISDHHVYISGTKDIGLVDHQLIKTVYSMDKSIFRNEYERLCTEPIDSYILDKMAKHDSMVYEIMERRFVAWNEIKFNTFQKRKDMYHRYINFAMYILKQNKINYYCICAIPHEPLSYILYCLCKELGIPTLMISGPFYKAYQDTYLVYFTEDIDLSCIEIQNLFNLLSNELKDKHISEIELNTKFTYLYNELARINEGLPKNDLQKLENVKSYPTRVKRYLEFILNTTEGIGHYKLLQIICSKLIEEFNFRIASQYYKKISSDVNYNDKYIYLALHYEPECALAPMAGFFANQLLIARILSASLPEGWHLYIKEHPAQNVMFNRGKYFYSELKKLRGVKILDKSVNTIELQTHAMAVATATGTVGLECQFMGKPVLMFGSHLYMYGPGAYKIRTFEDCVEAINDIQSGKTIDKKSMKIFLKCMKMISYEIPENNSLLETDQGRYELYLNTLGDGFLKRMEEKMDHNSLGGSR